MDLSDRINSDTFKKKQALQGTETIQVFVENETDVPFWKHVFNKCGLKTVVTPASKEGDFSRGKTVVLDFADRVGKFLLLCVDSDYDYLLQEATKTSKLINENVYIFQTYTYAVENHRCFAESLEMIMIEATLQDASQVFGYEAFMKKYSAVVYDLFVYFFCYERQNQIAQEQHTQTYQQDNNTTNTMTHTFSQKEFNKIVSFTDIDIFEGGRQALEDLAKRVMEKQATLPAVENIEDVKQALETLGVQVENVYCFINGHIIQSNVVEMFLKPLFNHLKNNKLQEIREKTAPAKLLGDKVNEYKNQTIDITKILQTHKHYENSPIFAKILADVGKFIETSKK